MRPHLRELGRRERTRLQEYRVGYRDLAEIVEPAALVEKLAVLGRGAMRRAHRFGVAADALRLMDRVPVPRLDRAREREEHALGRVEPLIQRALPEEHLRTDEELLRIERLAQVVVGAGGDAAEPRASVVRCREDDDRDQAAYRMRLQLLAH